jgi:hypothetical protein
MGPEAVIDGQHAARLSLTHSRRSRLRPERRDRVAKLASAREMG